MTGARGVRGVRVIVRAVALAAVGCLIAALTTGCAAGRASGGSSPSSPAAPLAAWQRVLDEIKPDGTVTVSTALAAFALAIGPVPGARAVPGPSQPIPSGTLAVDWVLAHWPALTAGQRRAVLTDLGVPVTTTSLTSLTRQLGRSGGSGGSAASNPNLPCLTADAGPAGPYRAEVAGIESDIADHIGAGPFTPDVYIAVNTKTLVAKSRMYTYGCTGTTPTDGTGSVSGCTIHVNPVVSGGAFPASEVHDFLIHELTHCYLFLKLGGVYGSLPSWYVEGAPSWTMSALGNGSAIASSFWQTYLSTPGTPLFARAYTAIGYFAHLAETGTDVWHRLIPMGQALAAGGNAAGWAAADPTTRFLSTWGSGYAEGRYPGSAWQTGGPTLPDYQGPIPEASVDSGESATVSAPAAAVGISDVGLTAQVVTFSGSPDASGRISLDDGVDATLDEAASTAYTTGSQDTCPSGTADAGAELTPISAGGHYVAVTGGLTAAAVQVTGMTLDAYCARTDAASCVVGSWTTRPVHVTLPAGYAEAGGAGVTMRIAADGATVIDFGSMSPIDVTGNGHAADFTFGGHVTGRLDLPKAVPAGSSFALDAAPGSAMDDQSLTVTIQITSPMSDTLGPMSISAMAAELGSEASTMPTAPGTEGTWTCDGNTLANHGPAGLPSYGTWAWTRTS